ncbi:MAG: hypothetical protein JW746_04045 [Candidatus Krumholzibacteriota bacterium]|nr:hypothetical protein [Candidatus Krumholzibacteriota bacterium]
MTAYRWDGNPYSSIYAVDLYSPESVPEYACGDLVLGQLKNGTVASSGKCLYYVDKHSADTDYHMLEIYEKVHGCDPSLEIAIGPVPIGETYKIGQNVTISWTCNGCPTRVDIKLTEDDINTVTLASLKKYDEPDLACNSITWQATGISSDPDNHYYRIKLYAWNIEGNYAGCWSIPFYIKETISYPKGNPIPIVAYSSSDGGEKNIPLPGLAQTDALDKVESYYTLLDNPIDKSGSITLSVESPSGFDLIIEKMELLAVDLWQNQHLTIDKGNLAITDNGRDYLHLTPSSDEKLSHPLLAGRYTPVSCGVNQEKIHVSSGENSELVFSVPSE